MNKTQKRQLNIKNKLIAAIAMLLVSSIMMVSSTYAWFTLSTAPEVQGITTTIGSNGNLEIALANPFGDNSLITSGVGDSNDPWILKNNTWGNLLNLEDDSYALNELTLLPSQLNIIKGDGNTANTLNGSPLMIPVYGADGRISELDGNKMNYGAKDPTGDGFLVNPTVVGPDGLPFNNYKGYGVRALGTSSTQSETELNFQIALNAINTYRGQANGKVTGAIKNYGSALADIAIMRQNEKTNGTTVNYVNMVPQLQAMIAELTAADALIEKALFNSLVAISNANLTYNGAPIGEAEVTAGKDLRTFLKESESAGMEQIWSNIPTAIQSAMNTGFPALAQSYNTWKSTKDQVEETNDLLAALPTDNVAWAQLSPAMNGLMNTNGVTLNGMSLDELDEQKLLENIANLNLELGEGSGVIANYAKLTGNISATVELSENAVYAGRNLKGFDINLVSNAPAGGALLTQVRTVVYGLGAAVSNDTTTALDVIYGYVLDFVFRTNAANSNLLLQTEGAQRIYEGGTNEATMGKGSTMTFSAAFSNLESLISMMSGIRVVFTNTTGESTDVYGIAKARFDKTPITLNLTAVTKGLNRTDNSVDEEREGVAGTNVTYTYADTYTEGATTATEVKLTVDSNGLISANNILLDPGMNDYQVLVREVVEDANGQKFERWTVKTMITYTVTEKVLTKANAADAGTYSEPKDVVKVLTDGEGKPLFYEDLDIDRDGDNDYYLNLTAAQAVTVTTSVWTPTGGAAVNTTHTDDNDDKNVYYELIAAAIIANEGQEIAGAESTDAETGVITQVITTYGTGYAAAIQAAHATSLPVYYHVAEQNVELEAPLYLHNYTIDANGVLSFGDPLSGQTLTGLDQNVITGVSALVYLDGNYVDNSDVVNSENGISTSGKMNLQFASSANLIPMENTALKNGEQVNVSWTKPDSLTVQAQNLTKATKEQDYQFGMASNDYTVTYQVGDGAVKTLTGELNQAMGVQGYVYTIPGEEVTGDIAITITQNTP